MPIGHGDDSIKREEVIQTAIDRAMNSYSRSKYSHVIYVGDRYWDREAAHKLKIDFVGIGKVFKRESQQFLCIEDYVSDDLLNYLAQKK